MDWRNVPTLAALRAFEAAARAGSFSAAARELNVTHAAIAQHVRALETDLGASLMHRVGKGMALTDDGRQLAVDLSDGFIQIIAGVRAVRAKSADQPLSVTVTPSFAENWLMPRLPKFWCLHPDITVSITPSNEVADLRREGFDVAIRYGNGNWPGVKSTFLGSADYVVVATPDLIGDRKVNCLSDLEDQPWLFETLHGEHRRWAANEGLNLGCCQIKEIATLNMLLSAVRAGGGLSVVSRALIANDIASGALTAVMEVERKDLGYFIVQLPGVETAKAKAFRKWLLSQT